MASARRVVSVTDGMPEIFCEIFTSPTCVNQLMLLWYPVKACTAISSFMLRPVPVAAASALYLINLVVGNTSTTFPIGSSLL